VALETNGQDPMKKPSSKRKPTAKWIAAQKFAATDIDIPGPLASRDAWVRQAEKIYPILRLALLMCGKDDKEIADMCARDSDAMVEALEATQDALRNYGLLVDLLNRAQARMLVGVERAIGEEAA
jgi:hypothetical protein